MARISNSEIDSFKKNIDLVKYMEDHGYSTNHSLSSERTTVLEDDNKNSKMSVSRDPTNYHMKFYDQRQQRGGAILEFTQNYLNKDYVEALYYVKSYAENDLNLVSFSQIKQAQVTKASTVSKDHFKFTPLRNTRYLTDRGISSETLQSPMFKDNIGQKEFMSKDNKPYSTTVFPMYNKIGGNDVVGLEKKSAMFSGSYEGSQKKNAFWKSTPISDFPDLVIVESGVDALSHFELNKNKNAFYIATNGQLSKDRLDVLKEYIEPRKHRFKSITSAMDKDLAGIKFNINIVGQINTNKENDELKIYVHGSNHHAKFTVESDDKKTLESFKDELNKLNNSLPLTSDFNAQYRDVNISEKDGVFKLDFNLNNREKAFAPLEKLVLENKKTVIQLEKPIDKDFGTDLENKLGIKRLSMYKIEGSAAENALVVQNLNKYNVENPGSFSNIKYTNDAKTNLVYNAQKNDDVIKFHKNNLSSVSSNLSHKKVKDVWKNKQVNTKISIKPKSLDDGMGM